MSATPVSATTAAAAPADDPAALADRLVSGRAGIVSRVVRRAHPFMGVYLATGYVSRILRANRDVAFAEGRGLFRLGSGVHVLPEVAYAKALSECVERYALVNGPWTRLPLKRASEVPDALAPSELALFDPAEMKESPHLARVDDEVDANRWIPVTDALSGERRWAPVSFCYKTFAGRTESVGGHFPSASACGRSSAEVLPRILEEAIERDAFALFWTQKRRLPRVDLDDISDGHVHLIERETRAAGLELAVFQMTADVDYPSFLATLIDRSGDGPALVSGTGCSAFWEDGVLKAVTEAVQMRLRAMRRVELGDHGYAWNDVDSLEQIPFIEGAPETVRRTPDPPDRAPETLARRALDALRERVEHVWVADITPPDLAGTGLVVQSCLAPGLVPKMATPRFVHAGTPRLYQPLPGATARPASRDDLHDLHICFP